MQLNDQSGIACDLCGISYRNDFTYYSFDFIPITKPRPPLEHLVNIKPINSLDMCTNCYDKQTLLIINNNKIKTRNSICEITGEPLNNKYIYCIVTKVNVQLSNNNSVNQNNRHLEFNLSEITLQQWIEQAKIIKDKTDEWTTKS